MANDLECPDCKGLGHVVTRDLFTHREHTQETEECSTCSGTGRIAQEMEVKMKIKTGDKFKWNGYSGWLENGKIYSVRVVDTPGDEKVYVDDHASKDLLQLLLTGRLPDPTDWEKIEDAEPVEQPVFLKTGDLYRWDGRTNKWTSGEIYSAIVVDKPGKIKEVLIGGHVSSDLLHVLRTGRLPTTSGWTKIEDKPVDPVEKPVFLKNGDRFKWTGRGNAWTAGETYVANIIDTEVFVNGALSKDLTTLHRNGKLPLDSPWVKIGGSLVGGLHVCARCGLKIERAGQVVVSVGNKDYCTVCGEKKCKEAATQKYTKTKLDKEASITRNQQRLNERRKNIKNNVREKALEEARESYAESRRGRDFGMIDRSGYFNDK